VHADNSNFTVESLLELPQLRKNMNAVDSTVRPEIEDHNAPAKIGEGARRTRGV
jgi:hypothetical protein